MQYIVLIVCICGAFILHSLSMHIAAANRERLFRNKIKQLETIKKTIEDAQISLEKEVEDVCRILRERQLKQ